MLRKPRKHINNLKEVKTMALESIFNSDYSINDKGKLLGNFFGSIVTEPIPIPQPQPEPIPIPEIEKFISLYGSSSIVALTNRGNIWKRNSTTGTWSKINLPNF